MIFVEVFKSTAFWSNITPRRSPLDDAAKFFFASLKSNLELNPSTRHAIVLGHDIERWLLKTAKAMAVSKNFARGGERLSGAFARDAAVLDMLDAPDHWAVGTGLYCTMNAGDLTENNPRFQPPTRYKQPRRNRSLRALHFRPAVRSNARTAEPRQASLFAESTLSAEPGSRSRIPLRPIG